MMSKRVIKTYGKKSRKPITDSSAAFDEIMQVSPKKSLTSTTNRFARNNSWNEKTNLNESKPMKGIERSPKRRKLTAVSEIDDDDPFAFDDEERVDVCRSSPSPAKKLFKEKVRIGSQSSSKSSDLDSESGSQEKPPPKGKSPQKSPFKNFLKNNDKTLSPKKLKKIKRFSILHLPTNADSETDKEEQNSTQDDTFFIPPKMVKAATWPVENHTPENAVRVKRQEKPLFTVVQNVKHKQECMEMGESQQFFDDVEYLLDGLKKDLPVNARCLSTLAMASNCTTPSFRVNLRAHGVIPIIFGHLSDAPANEMLALCTATVMLMLTQDRLNVDLDRSILDLMLKLLSLDKSVQVEASAKYSKDFSKCLGRIRNLMEKHPTLSEHLIVDELSAASLARESVLSLTSQRTGEWFKEEIRELGGLDHIITTVNSSIESIRKPVKLLHCEHINNLKTVDRCLRLLENVTYQNPDNQNHLATFQKSVLLSSISRLLRLCVNSISASRAQSTADLKVLHSTLKAILKCMLNITHDNETGSDCLGKQDSLMSSVLQCSLNIPQFIPSEERFDLLVLSLGLLINMVEHSNRNIHRLVEIQTARCSERLEDSPKEEENKEVSAIEGLMELFLARERAAKNSTDDMTSGLSTEDESSQEDGFKQTRDGQGWVFGDDIDMTVDESREPAQAQAQVKKSEASIEDEIGVALQKAGRHMEDSMVASYVAILLGCVAKDNKANQGVIRSLLPNQDFALLTDMLKKFLGFMKLTSGTSGHSIERVIKVLEEC